MTASLVTALFAAALIASLLARLWLATRQIRHVATHRGAVPAAFAGTVSLEAHQRAADYTIAKLRYGILAMAWGAALLVGWTLLGGLDALNGWLLTHARPALGELGTQLALLAGFALIGALLDLPWEAWHTFRLEARYGFTRTTPALWLGDQLKGAAVAAVLGLPIVAVILALMGAAGAPMPMYLSFIEPASTFNLNYAIGALASPMIGGTMHYLGPVIGALLLSSLQQLVTVTVSSEMNVLIVGVLLVVFVVVAPEGIVGLWRKWTRRSSR